MAVLESIMAFNAGYAVLKNTIQNGKEISGVLGSLANMIGAEEDLRAKGNRKKSSIWSKAFGKSADMMEEFQALQDIKRKRAELKSMIQLYADFTWDEYVAYEAKVRIQRKQEAEEREKAIARIVNYCTWAAAATLSLVGIYFLYSVTDFLKGL
jgi:hypothetical protein